MKVLLNRADLLLELIFETDDTDGITPVDRVWFEFNRKIDLDSSRVVLIAYALCADRIGNTFNVEGVCIPAHLASAINNSFGGQDIFIGGISNIPKRILPKLNNQLTTVTTYNDSKSSVDAVGNDYCLLLRRTASGYCVQGLDGESILSIKTNVDIYAGLSITSLQLVVPTVLFLLLVDSYSVINLHIVDTDEMTSGKWLIDCVREVGGNVSISL